MNSEDKVVSLIVKLNKLTSLTEITWSVEQAPQTILKGTDDVIPLFLVATYKGQRFGLYQHRYQYYDGEHDRSHWTERLVLVVLDPQNRVLWETAGYYPALVDLFETARRKVSNIDSLLDKLLSDDEDNNP